MEFNTVLSTSSFIIDGVKMLLEYKDKKEYKDFIKPYRDDFKELISNAYTCILHPENIEYKIVDVVLDYIDQKGVLRARRGLDLMKRMGILYIPDGFIPNRDMYVMASGNVIFTDIGSRMTDTDIKFIYTQLESSILDPYLLEL